MITRWVGACTGLLALGLAASEASAACSEDEGCSGGPARIMLIDDASSDELNVAGEGRRW